MKNLVIIILLIPTYCLANEWKVAVGALSKSLNTKRGMITYQGHQISPIFSIEKEGLPLMIAGSSLYYRQKIEGDFFVRSRLHFNATGDHPAYFTETPESETLQREQTNEWNVYLEHQNNEHYIRFELSRDLNAHESNYFEVHSRFALFDYKKPGMKAVIQPSIYAAIGNGDEEHNQYLYGQSAQSGVNHYELGFVIASPNVIDPFFPTLKLNYFEILGDDNREAEFVEHKQGISFEFLFAFRIFS